MNTRLIWTSHNAAKTCCLQITKKFLWKVNFTSVTSSRRNEYAKSIYGVNNNEVLQINTIIIIIIIIIINYSLPEPRGNACVVVQFLLCYNLFFELICFFII